MFGWNFLSSLGITRWQTSDNRHLSSKGPSSADDDQHKSKAKEKDKLKKEEARLKLNSLLESIEKVCLCECFLMLFNFRTMLFLFSVLYIAY